MIDKDLTWNLDRPPFPDAFGGIKLSVNGASSVTTAKTAVELVKEGQARENAIAKEMEESRLRSLYAKGLEDTLEKKNATIDRLIEKVNKFERKYGPLDQKPIYAIPEANITPVRIIVSGPATVVFWKDGKKTIVKCSEGEPYSLYNAYIAALAIKLYGTNTQLKKVIKKIASVKILPDGAADENLWQYVSKAEKKKKWIKDESYLHSDDPNANKNEVIANNEEEEDGA